MPEHGVAGTTAKKKALPEGSAIGVEAGFIQARNLSSSERRIRNYPGADKPISRTTLRKRTNRLIGHALAILLALGASGAARAEPAHGIAMHGDPALPEGFAHLPYADPEAPKGGTVVYGEAGSWDSLNPYIVKGRSPWQLRMFVAESLMARSWDEPFTLYGLLAETVETPPDRSWVEFTLREEARFSDGSPVTVEDVIYSMKLLGEKGHPRYLEAWQAVESIEQTGPRSVRIDFASPNRELPMLMGLRPILKKDEWERRDFTESSLEPFTGSGPYVIGAFEPGRFLELRRNPDYWGRDLPVNRGLYNFDVIRFEYYLTGEAVWEAFAAGLLSIFKDDDPKRWEDGYTFPAAVDGRIVRGEIPHSRPSGMEGFVFNTRREIFADRRVREALTLAFDWEWINARLYGDEYARITSYWSNSDLAFSGPAEGLEAEILAPFDLPEGTLEEGWTPPASDGSGRNRGNLRRAGKLLDEAGWTVTGGTRANAAGKPLAFEILVTSKSHETLASVYAESLKRLGVDVSVRMVDSAQYAVRRDEYDYDVIVNRWYLSLSPGTEQYIYFAPENVSEPGGRNYAGITDPAVEATIGAMLEAETLEDFRAAVRAHDRVLTSGIYVLPWGYLPTDRLAWLRGFAKPERDSLYGYRMETWYAEPAE